MSNLLPLMNLIPALCETLNSIVLLVEQSRTDIRRMSNQSPILNYIPSIYTTPNDISPLLRQNQTQIERMKQWLSGYFFETNFYQLQHYNDICRGIVQLERDITDGSDDNREELQATIGRPQVVVTHGQLGTYAEIGVGASEELITETLMPFIQEQKLQNRDLENRLMNHFPSEYSFEEAEKNIPSNPDTSFSLSDEMESDNEAGDLKRPRTGTTDTSHKDKRHKPQHQPEGEKESVLSQHTAIPQIGKEPEQEDGAEARPTASPHNTEINPEPPQDTRQPDPTRRNNYCLSSSKSCSRGQLF